MPSEQELWNNIFNSAKRAELEKRFDRAIKLTAPGSLERKRIELFRREFMNPMHQEAEKYQARNRVANVMKLIEGRVVMLNSRKPAAGEKSPAITMFSVKRQQENLLVKFQFTEPFMDKTVAVKRQFDDPATYRDNEVEF